MGLISVVMTTLQTSTSDLIKKTNDQTISSRLTSIATLVLNHTYVEKGHLIQTFSNLQFLHI